MKADLPGPDEASVSSPTGTEFVIRIGRTGVSRLTMWGGAPRAVSFMVTFARWLRGPRTWTVQVSMSVLLPGGRVLSEDLVSAHDASARADELADAIVSGAILFDAGRSGDACPQSGVWALESRPDVRVNLRRGDPLPTVDGSDGLWRLAQPFADR